MKTPRSRSGGTLGKVMMYAPIALELLTLMRRSQGKRRGKYTKARKRDRAFDFLLGQAQKRMKKQGARRW
ncbi:hypothetical protein [Deinococcus hopiensis]|nr:hypothetical protein [Deinococcus hopiensis]